MKDKDKYITMGTKQSLKNQEIVPNIKEENRLISHVVNWEADKIIILQIRNEAGKRTLKLLIVGKKWRKGKII